MSKKATTKRGPFKRVLLKLSGEALTEPNGSGVNGKVLKALAENIASVRSPKTEVAVVIGGGNIWRYRDHDDLPIERAASDQMGMLATVMNAIALQNALGHIGADSRVQTALNMPAIAEPYVRRRAIRHLEKGRIVIFAAGIGQPYFTTDTAAATRALEIGADVLLKGSTVDGVYDSDPNENKQAKRFEEVGYTDILSDRLGVMDATAVSLCRENGLPVIIFDVFNAKNLKGVVTGKPIGTIVTES